MLLGTLPFRSEQRGDPEFTYDVSVWHSPVNICEQVEDGVCDSVAGLYYSPTDDHVTRYCPRHFYVMHLGDAAAYRFVDGSEDRPKK